MIAPEKGGMENDTPGKGGILQDQKMVENVPPENDGMENDSPGKRRNNTGPENGGKCTTGKRLPWKTIAPEKD